MKTPRLIVLSTLILLWFAGNFVGQVQRAAAQEDLISISVNAGFDGRFRPDMWLPLNVSITNNGDPLEGYLAVRPQRSSGLVSSFTTPISLPSGARQSAFLYTTMRSFGTSITVELFDDNDRLISDLEVPLRQLAPRDRVHIIVTNANSSSIDFTDISTAGQQAAQVNWFPANIPDHSAALHAANTIVFSDVDSGTLTPAQRDAITAWVAQGGHLIITGGASWQPTAAAFREVLPLVPDASETVNEVTEIARLAGDYSTDFTGAYTAASGRLSDDAEVLAQAGDLPLLVRRSLGSGTVDYLALDPSLEPLRDWAQLRALWFTLLTSVDPRPAWTYNALDAAQPTNSLEILPGVNALPEIMAMVLFLGAYVLIVGPLNYLVLSRFNRRELAWFTIPLFISIFSVMAWVTGFNLRGSEVILSRLTVVQSWPTSESAQQHQYIGLLAPRRGSYNLSLPDDRTLRPITDEQQAALSINGSAAITINQTTRFEALDFPVDASFVAGFATVSTTERPDISGSVTVALGPSNELITMRGSIRNDSGETLFDPVLLAANQVVRLGGMLEPGSVRPFNHSQRRREDNVAAASPIEYSIGSSGTANTGFRAYQPAFTGIWQSAADILGRDTLSTGRFGITQADETEQELLRREELLRTIMADQLDSTARADRVYLAAWSQNAGSEENLGGVPWRPVDSTLYLVELNVEQNLSGSSALHIVRPEHFSWTAVERENFGNVTPTNATLFSEGSVVFRFTPNAAHQLREVNALTLIFERESGTLREAEISLWNWEKAAWEAITINTERIDVRTPQRFIGPRNAVQLRLTRSTTSGQLAIRRIAFEQRGRL